MPMHIKGFYRELLRLLVIAVLVFPAMGTGAARADPAWTQTSQTDFETGTLFQVDTASSPGDVKLAIALPGSNYVYAFRGGWSNNFWEYGISGDSWTSMANAPHGVSGGGALAHGGGNYIYALRGGDRYNFWRYNISADSWTSLTSVPKRVKEGGALVYNGGNYVYALRGGGRDDFWRYDISTNLWASMADAPVGVYGGGALTYDGGNYIYALKGHSQSFWRYDIPADSWTSKANTPHSVGDGGALACDNGNYVYALRGDGNDDFWRYDVSTNTWSSMADTPSTPCVDGGGALVYDSNGYIYALRGDGNDDFWRYDISGNSWTTMTDTPNNVAYGGALTMARVSYHSSGTLTSSAHDTGYSADFGNITWTATTPAGTSVKFQIATNNDNSTWNFKGPDGTSGTYYTSSGFSIWAGHDNDRYIKYQAVLSTTDSEITPALHDVSVTYNQQIVSPTVTTGNATLVEETTATLHGTVTNDGSEACQYQFKYGTAPGGPYPYATGWTGSKTTGQSFSADITGLGEGTRYYFRAQAKNSTGSTSGSELSFLTKPDPPTAFTASVISNTRIDLSWTKGAGANKTMIRRKTGDYPSDKNDGVQVYFDAGTTASDTGLSPGTTYYYRAWSEVSGSQQWSDGYAAASATTSGAPVPTAVGGIVYPVNKAGVLAPWLILFSIVSLAIVGGLLSWRKRV